METIKFSSMQSEPQTGNAGDAGSSKSDTQVVLAQSAQHRSPRTRSNAFFPRWKGGRDPNPLANNSEHMRGILQPDPWSVATLYAENSTSREGVHKPLFATHSNYAHGATLVWPGVDWGDAEAARARGLATPRFLSKRDIVMEALRTSPRGARSCSATGRSTFGRGQLAFNGDPSGDMVARRPEVRGKYTG